MPLLAVFAAWAADLYFEGFTCISEKLACGIEGTTDD